MPGDGLAVGTPGGGNRPSFSMEDAGWDVTETAAWLCCNQVSLSQLLTGRIGVSEKMALALEQIGWDTAEHWLRIQKSYEHAKA